MHYIFFFLSFVPLVTKKVVLASKKLISTSEGRAEHPFAGRNTQHLFFKFYMRSHREANQQPPLRVVVYFDPQTDAANCSHRSIGNTLDLGLS